MTCRDPRRKERRGSRSGDRSVGAEAGTFRAGARAAHAEWRGDVLQGLALGVHTEERRDQAADDHDGRAEEVAVEERAPVLTLADQGAVDDRPQGTEALGDREEDRDRLRPDLLREDLGLL